MIIFGSTVFSKKGQSRYNRITVKTSICLGEGKERLFWPPLRLKNQNYFSSISY